MSKKYLVAFLPVMLLLVLIPSVASAESTYRGIDVSVYQGEIDFKKVKDSGIDAVYIRAGEGTNIIDSQFEANYEGARKAGLKYGFYHYVTARSVEDARAQADFFARLIRSKPYDMKAAMDFENLSGLTASESVAIAKAYLDELEKKLGHSPAVYSDAYDASTVWKNHLKDYTLWVADYGVSSPYSTGGWKTWGGFQYSDRGDVDGISGHVDMDYYRESMLLTKSERSRADDIRKKNARFNGSCSYVYILREECR